MPALFDDLLKHALALPMKDRARLVHDLLESLDRDVNPDIQAAWDAEIENRVAKYERGEGKLFPVEEVLADARRLTE